jgi:hypothetical protein
LCPQLLVCAWDAAFSDSLAETEQHPARVKNSSRELHFGGLFFGGVKGDFVWGDFRKVRNRATSGNKGAFLVDFPAE